MTSADLAAALLTEMRSPPELDDIAVWIAGMQGLLAKLRRAQQQERRAMRAQKEG